MAGEEAGAFLQATVKEPDFWYGLSVTTGLLFILVAYTKLYLDHRRSLRITAEMMADIYAHDLHSRQAANEAIEKYNRHTTGTSKSATVRLKGRSLAMAVLAGATQQRKV